MEKQTPDNDVQVEKSEQGAQTFIGTYKTKEDAEKGFEEKQKHILKIEAENRLLREQIQSPRPTAPVEDVEEKQFYEKLDSSFDKEQQEALRTLVKKEAERLVQPIKSRFEEQERSRTVESIKKDFTDYDNPEVVEAVKNKVLDYADKGVKLNLYDAYLLVQGREAITKAKQLSEKLRSNEQLDSFVDGGGSSAPVERDKGVDAELDFLLGKRDPRYGRG